MTIFTNLFSQVALLLLLATLIGAVALRLRQPLIIAFIAVGVLLGPSVLGWVSTQQESLHFLAELGLALLLFVVGLKLDLTLIRTVGPVSLATGLGQIVFTAAVGYLITLALGVPPQTALYIAVALSFASTIIIVKLLSDKREIDSLHGRIAIGFLIVEDIGVVITMIILSSMAGKSGISIGAQLLGILIKGAAVVAGLGILMTYVIPKVLNTLARSAELLVLTAIAWAVTLATLGDAIGFGKEVGAFLAGISLASTQYREMIGARLVTLRDFLLLFFFIDLGTRLDLTQLGSLVWIALPLSLFVLISKPLIVMVIMGFMGYRKRTSFLAGLAVSQISEFSLILITLGFNLGHVPEDAVGLVTLIALITIATSTYMIIYSNNLYERLSPYLGVFERKVPHREQLDDAALPSNRAEIILFGLGRYGSNMGSDLRAQGRSLLGVDFDPQAVRRWNESGGGAVFGDAEDPEFPSTLPLAGARWVISSLRQRDINLTLIQSLRSYAFTGGIAVTANSQADADALRNEGANLVFIPYDDAAAEAADLLTLADQQEARRKMDNLIANLRDHYIVCGYGRMGRQIVKDFQRNGLPFVVVEHNPVQLPSLVEDNIPHVEGRATEDETLIKAGIERARGLVSVTATDEENVFIALTARGLNPRLYIVARSIQQENEGKLRKAGADRVISPYIYGGRRIAAAILRPKETDFLDLLENDEVDLEVENLTLFGTSSIINSTVSAFREAYGALVLAIKRDGQIHPNPAPELTIDPGDELIVMGTRAQLASAERAANP